MQILREEMADLAAVENKSVTEIMEEVRDEICNHYCKYPIQPIPEGKTEDWLFDDPDSPCQNCLLDRL